ncbi:Uncharacterized protein FWK35_00008713 [Aphis craccivora]|uniref:Uncharacterized protein n=1 Tax=Aphis craccivora TaxID=307492 RepID=A0A6G0YFR5_APHCR|nr:Uncharacterized protein FWK35_00008713 [Aphis craccivora]
MYELKHTIYTIKRLSICEIRSNDSYTISFSAYDRDFQEMTRYKTAASSSTVFIPGGKAGLRTYWAPGLKFHMGPFEKTSRSLYSQNDTFSNYFNYVRIAEIQRRKLNQMKEIVHSKVRGGKRTYQAQHHYTQNGQHNGNKEKCGQYQTNQRQAKGYSQ